MKIPVLLTIAFTSVASLAYAQTGSTAKMKPAPSTMSAEEMSPSDKALVAYAGEETSTLTASQKASLLSLANTGDMAAIQKINGIGESKAKNIIAKRPYKSVEDLIMVDGVGKSTFKDVVIYAKGEQKEDPAKPVASTKSTPVVKTPAKPKATPAIATAATPAATPKPKKVKAPAAATPAPTVAATPAATPKVKKEKMAKAPAATPTPAASPAASPTPKKAKTPKKVVATPTPTP